MTVLYELHRDVDGISVDIFKRAKESDEQILMLEIC